MTTEELWEVLDARLTDMEQARNQRFDGIDNRLDRLNGTVAEHARDIGNLKVRIAYWAGGALVLATIIGWLR